MKFKHIFTGKKPKKRYIYYVDKGHQSENNKATGAGAASRCEIIPLGAFSSNTSVPDRLITPALSAQRDVRHQTKWLQLESRWGVRMCDQAHV